ncbi:histidine kinase [Solwaraspora sp. WMMD937]|uniref:sensor histidine kinase n=1 Tax=Solwaraspora sp. WMMD937 TaxID=3016090 RepID=UPI00249AE2C8|nr:histidine kinase [Solwaraspora sp. WMMD937]WFE20752.1 histidine kinase [Solwaraspora sp. WMMD937]
MNGGTVQQVRQALRHLVVGPDLPPPPAPPTDNRRRAVGRWLAFALFLVVSVVAALDQQGTGLLPAPVGLILGFVTVAPAALAYHRPLWAWRISILLLFFGAVWHLYPGPDPWSLFQVLALLFVLAILAGRAELAVSAAAGAVTAVPVLVFVAPNPGLWLLAVLAVVVAAMDQVRRRRVSQHALASQTVVTQQEQQRRAVLEERARIAREMHDVVAHHMSMIAVQAETAPYRLTAMTEPTRDEFTAIAGAARSALGDMRRLLGVLRSETEQAHRAPQPGLGDIATMVEATRRAGLDAELVADPRLDRVAVAGPVGLAAYRIVQEALANAGRHAPGAAVLVELRAGADQLMIRVGNGPATLAAGAERSIGGHGVVGMRERAELLGGSFAAGPDGRSGFVVTAGLPYRTVDTDARTDAARDAGPDIGRPGSVPDDDRRTR